MRLFIGVFLTMLGLAALVLAFLSTSGAGLLTRVLYAALGASLVLAGVSQIYTFASGYRTFSPYEEDDDEE